MALVDPYATCPCGSGQKFKWCCIKVEQIAERALKLLDGGQNEAALAALDAGLRSHPDHIWLSRIKSSALDRLDRHEESYQILEPLARKHPKNIDLQLHFFRRTLAEKGPVVAAMQLQMVLVDCAGEENAPVLGNMALLMGSAFANTSFADTAVKHLTLARRLGAQIDDPARYEEAVHSIQSQQDISPWLRNSYYLSQPPEELDREVRTRFLLALQLANEGKWAPAAIGFERIASEDHLPLAARNAGLCYFWVAEVSRCVPALRRYIESCPDTLDAVDLEALCQLIEIEPESEKVEMVHLIWTLRDRDRLFQALNNHSWVQHEGTRPLEIDDSESFPVESFQLLDRELSPDADPDNLKDLPRVRGRALIGSDIAIIEGWDDGRLDQVTNWFTSIAGPAIPPAQPRTKVVGKISRASLAVAAQYALPAGLQPEQIESLESREHARILQEVWPDIPQYFLGGLSPRAAASVPRHHAALRAALNIYRQTEGENPEILQAINSTRAMLNVPGEPEIAPELSKADLKHIHITRLASIPAGRLPDEQLLAFYKRCRAFAVLDGTAEACQAILDRPSLLETDPNLRFEVTRLLVLKLSQDKATQAKAREILDESRQAASSSRTMRASAWDSLDLMLQAMTQELPEWVPRLAVLLDRYKDNNDAMVDILATLVPLGLVRPVTTPDQPGRILLDGRMLQALLERYGPRITTAAGTLGISATQGGIWTPDSDAPPAGTTTSGGIWTPGSPTSTPGEKPRLFVPGQ